MLFRSTGAIRLSLAGCWLEKGRVLRDLHSCNWCPQDGDGLMILLMMLMRSGVRYLSTVVIEVVVGDR